MSRECVEFCCSTEVLPPSSATGGLSNAHLRSIQLHLLWALDRAQAIEPQSNLIEVCKRQLQGVKGGCFDPALNVVCMQQADEWLADASIDLKWHGIYDEVNGATHHARCLLEALCACARHVPFAELDLDHLLVLNTEDESRRCDSCSARCEWWAVLLACRLCVYRAGPGGQLEKRLLHSCRNWVIRADNSLPSLAPALVGALMSSYHPSRELQSWVLSLLDYMQFNARPASTIDSSTAPSPLTSMLLLGLVALEVRALFVPAVVDADCHGLISDLVAIILD